MFNLYFRKTRLKVIPENLGPFCLCSEFPFQVGKIIGCKMLYAFGNSREVKMDCLLPKHRKSVNWMTTRYNLWMIFPPPCGIVLCKKGAIFFCLCCHNKML